MGTFDDFLHRLRCSMHPQLRHYSAESLKDDAEYRHVLEYWNLPESFRRECEATFQGTGTTAYYSWNEKCVFSFSTLTPPCTHAALLRNIFVPKEHRGQHCCTEALSRIVSVAEASATCILAIVHPFEIHAESRDLNAAIDALHRSAYDVSYVSSSGAIDAMNTRLKRAGFVNCDLRDSMSNYGIETIPITRQWIYLPSTLDKPFSASLASRLVNEVVDDAASNRLSV
jgi:hypothetical protein